MAGIAVTTPHSSQSTTICFSVARRGRGAEAGRVAMLCVEHGGCRGLSGSRAGNRVSRVWPLTSGAKFGRGCHKMALKKSNTFIKYFLKTKLMQKLHNEQDIKKYQKNFKRQAPILLSNNPPHLLYPNPGPLRPASPGSLF